MQLGLLLDTTLGFLFGVLVDTLSDDGKGDLFGYNIELLNFSIIEYLKMIKYNEIGCLMDEISQSPLSSLHLPP